MNNSHEHWQKIISRHKPGKLHGVLWYRSVYKTRRHSIMNMDGAFLFGGRYNPPENFGALYLSDSSEGCVTEMARRPVIPRDYLIGEIKVTVSKICDLTDPALLEQLGINPDALCKDEWELTQELGELIRDAGFEGVIVNSAAGPFKNLVLFLDHFSNKSSIELINVRTLVINDE